MNKKQFTILFILEYAVLLLSAGLLFWLNRRTGPLLDVSALGTQFLYIYGLVCAVSTVLGVYLALSRRSWNPVLRLSVLTSPAILVLFDKFIFQDTNMVYCLPLLVVASFMLLKNVYDN
ncbi:MAG: hypothetical protein IJR87_05570 [Bacteroidaceae bacterium]|nr:hypothetical protein [Bacteroidaceae bacterium]